MEKASFLEEFIARAGVYYNVKGVTPKEIYKNITGNFGSFEGISSEAICHELCMREELISTAVGNGIAIPHPRSPLLKNTSEQSIFVCFLDKPVMMDCPDGKAVYVMFVVLSANKETHLKVLSELAFLLNKKEFRNKLEQKPIKTELLQAIHNFL